MIKHRDHFHGSDLEKIETIYHIRKEDITSFSANVNPLGISPKLREELAAKVDVIASYPDREYTALRHAIAGYCGAEAADIVVGNGTSELISLFIQITHPKRALILGPTYSEYEREISLTGGRTHYYPLRAQESFVLDIDEFTGRLTDEIDLIVLCNPNNPTGTAITSADMRRILDACKQHHCFVLVDETYIEFVEDYEAVSSVPLCRYYNNIIVLRGTSKFFAAPGLRLGYAVCGNADLLDEISHHKSPWMVGALADAAGQIMFSDQDYIRRTKELISTERNRLYDIFAASGSFKPFRPQANFMLLEILDPAVNSHTLFDRAIRQGMMIRDCSTFPFLSDRFVRICFMLPEANDRLVACMLGTTAQTSAAPSADRSPA